MYQIHKHILQQPQKKYKLFQNDILQDYIRHNAQKKDDRTMLESNHMEYKSGICQSS